MIELKFDIAKIASTDIESIPKDDLLSVISETCFLLPVQLTINNEDIFKINEDRKWIELSAFDILLNWIDILKKIPEKGIGLIFLADAGQMSIERNSQDIKVSTNFNDITVLVNYDEFCSRVTESVNDILNDLRDEFPDIFDLEELQILKASQ